MRRMPILALCFVGWAGTLATPIVAAPFSARLGDVRDQIQERLEGSSAGSMTPRQRSALEHALGLFDSDATILANDIKTLKELARHLPGIQDGLHLDAGPIEDAIDALRTKLCGDVER